MQRLLLILYDVIPSWVCFHFGVREFDECSVHQLDTDCSVAASVRLLASGVCKTVLKCAVIVLRVPAMPFSRIHMHILFSGLPHSNSQLVFYSYWACIVLIGLFQVCFAHFSVFPTALFIFFSPPENRGPFPSLLHKDPHLENEFALKCIWDDGPVHTSEEFRVHSEHPSCILTWIGELGSLDIYEL